MYNSINITCTYMATCKYILKIRSKKCQTIIAIANLSNQLR